MVRKIKMALGLTLIALSLCSCSKDSSVMVGDNESINESKEKDYSNISREELIVEVDVIVENYNNSLVTYEEAKESLTDMLGYFERGDGNKNIITDAIKMLDTLKRSKKAYNSGVSYLDDDTTESKKYAIKEFGKVVLEDINYDEAQAHLKSLEKEYYDEMISIIGNYIDNDEYFYAIKTYEGLIDTLGNYNDVENKYEETKSEYSQVSIEEAESLMRGGDFEKAKCVIESCIDEIGERDELVAELERINLCTPTSLCSLEEFYRDKTVHHDVYRISEWLEDYDQWLDNEGNSWMEGIYVNGHNSEGGYVKITYLLDGKYDNLEGTLCLSNGSKNSNFEDGCYAHVYIYGDGVLLYKSDYISGGVRPMDISVNVSGVQELCVEFEMHKNLSVAFVEPTLYKDLEE